MKIKKLLGTIVRRLVAVILALVMVLLTVVVAVGIPLAEGAKVSLLSQNSVDLVYGGAGAGSIDTSQVDDLKTVLEQNGFKVNSTLWDFYLTGEGAAYRKQVPDITGQGAFAANEVPMDVYTDAVIASVVNLKQ